MELFLVSTNLVANFSFEPVPGKPLPTLEPRASFVRQPQHFEVVIKPRK